MLRQRVPLPSKIRQPLFYISWTSLQISLYAKPKLLTHISLENVKFLFVTIFFLLLGI